MRAIDLFAGAGGFSLAAHKAGVDVIAAVEFDQSAATTYQNNLVERLNVPTQVHAKDINAIDIPQFMADLGIEEGELDLLLGGPPCQGFSGHRLGDSSVNDPRNQLLIKYFDFVHAIKPKVFLVENVPGLLWKRHEQHLNKFLDLASENGYNVYQPERINAKDYGVPQNRLRVFILGVREDIQLDDIQWPPRATHFKPGTRQPAWLTASTVFERPPQEELDRLFARFVTKDGMEHEQAWSLIDSLQFGKPIPSPEEDPCAFHMNHTPELIQRFAKLGPNGSRDEFDEQLPCHSNGHSGHKDVYGRVRYHIPGPTMTTGCYNPSKGRFVHLWHNHGITLRHAARFQTFPDDYIFHGNATAQARQIGNAVPIELGRHLITEICSRLN
ncbi:DNA cytosine methyltransferase [Photobacterium ganghwense]|uniref:DNA cytosine methyltransferase n=1 Tax=Photobacterium ganghwense TaxID=320778 RepID=UPI001A8F2606|nr:DNA (cytosine-5-)-methyltransferase [Photobacterium ganghwense]QSV15859.1 DNA (cytosine-5-)-methyltransferase [Photobacterium ganghwense]